MKNVKSGHSRPIVCLDAGHYGKYNQSPAVKSYYESDMTWKLHLLLKKELEGYNIEVCQTRPNKEIDMGLKDRGKASAGADLFLSLHSNAIGSGVNESVDYVAVYHLYEDAGTDVDDKSKVLAKLLSPAIADVMDVKQGSKILSRKGSGDWNGDGVMNDNYYGVLNGARLVGTPGLILEHSFHTNTRSTKWLLDEANLRKLAQVEAAIIATWFDVAKKQNEVYRVRKSWEDAESQIGAYSILDNAKANCPKGYTVYDWNGKAVYANAPRPTTCTLELPVLKKGDKGDDVKAAQNLLIANKHTCGTSGADGSLGADTRKSVIDYQRKHNLKETGVVDAETWKSLLGL